MGCTPIPGGGFRCSRGGPRGVVEYHPCPIRGCRAEDRREKADRFSKSELIEHLRGHHGLVAG